MEAEKVVMKAIPVVVAVAIALLLASCATAAYMKREHEEYGPALPPFDKSASNPIDAFRFHPGRRYLLRKSWSGFGIYHAEEFIACGGDADAANDAMAAFAELPFTRKEIRFFPGPGQTHSRDAKTTFSCDWQIHLVNRIIFPQGDGKVTEKSDFAVMTVFVARGDPNRAFDLRMALWIRELGDDRFSVRQRAFQAIADLGETALPALRQAQFQNLEQRVRIQQLLIRLQSIHLSRLRFPKGVTLVSWNDLLDKEQENWRSGDFAASWRAAEQISNWAEHSDTTLPVLVEMLKDDRVQVQELAVMACKRLGKLAAKILPDIRILAKNDGNIYVGQAISAIEQAPDVTGVDEHWAKKRRLAQQITEVCRLAKSAQD